MQIVLFSEIGQPAYVAIEILNHHPAYLDVNVKEIKYVKMEGRENVFALQEEKSLIVSAVV